MTGRVAFAVAERGRPIRGLATARVYSSASVVKAMLLIAVLRAHRHRALPAARRAPLEPMVRSSDNDAASAVYAQVGAAGLRDVARAARMRRFLDVGYWSGAQITAADQARLFLRLHAVVPRRHRRYARRLLAGIVHEQRWGIAAVADRHGLRNPLQGRLAERPRPPGRPCRASRSGGRRRGDDRCRPEHRLRAGDDPRHRVPAAGARHGAPAGGPTG